MAEADQDPIEGDVAETGEQTDGTPATPPDPSPPVETLPPSPGAPELLAVQPPGPPSIADGAIRHLDERYIELSRTIGVIVTAVIAAAGLIGGIGVPAVAGAPGWAIVLLAIGCGAVTICAGYLFNRWPAFEHPYHSYRVNPRGIEIHHGVWFRSVVNVARSRVQHTDVSQGPIERRYGLATLHIHTAGTDQAEVTLPGLEHSTALAIRDYLVTGGEDDAV